MANKHHSDYFNYRYNRPEQLEPKEEPKEELKEELKEEPKKQLKVTIDDAYNEIMAITIEPQVQTEPDPLPIKSKFYPYLVCVKDNVSRRKGPSEDYKVNGYIPKNDVFKILEETKDLNGDSWGKIDFGWIPLNKCKKVGLS